MKSLLLLVILASSGFASEKVLLYEFHKDRFIEVPRPIPNRLHAAVEPKIGKLVFRMADENGKFPDTGDSLMVGSILDGKWIGGDPGKRYRLDKIRKWVVTTAPEDHWYYQPGRIANYYHRFFSAAK